MIRVVTVDDEPLARERVSALVRATDGLSLVGEAANGLEALDLIVTLKPELAFIDVEMPELSGFGVITALGDQKPPGVVFVTAFEQYALKAFDVGAIDYLHKPVSNERFAEAVSRARARLGLAPPTDQSAFSADIARLERSRGFRTRFVVRRGATHHFVPVDQVDWIDVADNYLQLHLGDQIHLARGTMNDAAEELDPRLFVRIHRSTMVAIERIASINSREAGGFTVTLRTGVRLNCSRGYADGVRALLSPGP